MPSLELELSMFLAMVLTGAGAGVIFDFYGAIPGVSRARGWRRHLYDLFLWIFLAPVVLVGFVLGNWGDLRFYVPLGLVLGLVFYELTAGPLMRRAFQGMFFVIGKVLSWLGKALGLVVLPARAAWKAIAGRIFRRKGGPTVPPGDAPPAPPPS